MAVFNIFILLVKLKKFFRLNSLKIILDKNIFRNELEGNLMHFRYIYQFKENLYEESAICSCSSHVGT